MMIVLLTVATIALSMADSGHREHQDIGTSCQLLKRKLVVCKRSDGLVETFTPGGVADDVSGRPSTSNRTTIEQTIGLGTFGWLRHIKTMMKSAPLQVISGYYDLLIAWIFDLIAEKAFDHLFAIAFKTKP